MFKNTVAQCRSYRRFYQDERIAAEQLIDWIDTARITASSGNRQPLKYYATADPEQCAKIFDCCAWAAALPEWKGPQEGERPSAYIVIMHDTNRSLGEKFTCWDEGIAAQTIALAATDAGFGACILGSIKKKSLADELELDSQELEVDLVIALGKSKEDVRIVGVPEDGSTHYWRDDKHIHYVPKRALEDVLIS